MPYISRGTRQVHISSFFKKNHTHNQQILKYCEISDISDLLVKNNLMADKWTCPVQDIPTLFTVFFHRLFSSFKLVWIVLQILVLSLKWYIKQGLILFNIDIWPVSSKDR